MLRVKYKNTCHSEFYHRSTDIDELIWLFVWIIFCRRARHCRARERQTEASRGSAAGAKIVTIYPAPMGGVFHCIATIRRKNPAVYGGVLQYIVVDDWIISPLSTSARLERIGKRFCYGLGEVVWFEALALSFFALFEPIRNHAYAAISVRAGAFELVAGASGH